MGVFELFALSSEALKKGGYGLIVRGEDSRSGEVGGESEKGSLINYSMA